MVGRLLKTMYGTRDAANQFDEFSKAIVDEGFISGLSCPCIYRHSTEQSIGWRHGDDMIFVGEAEFLEKVFKGLSKSLY